MWSPLIFFVIHTFKSHVHTLHSSHFLEVWFEEQKVWFKVWTTLLRKNHTRDHTVFFAQQGQAYHLSHQQNKSTSQFSGAPMDPWHRSNVQSSRLILYEWTNAHLCSINLTFFFQKYEITPFYYRHLFLTSKITQVPPIFNGPRALQPLYIKANLQDCQRGHICQEKSCAKHKGIYNRWWSCITLKVPLTLQFVFFW